MKIQIKWPATAGDLAIPAGEYEVKVGHESGQIVLSQGEKTFKLAGTKRPSKAPVRFATVSLRPSQGDPIWILQAAIPPNHEWLVFIKMPKPVGDGKITYGRPGEGGEKS